MMTNLEQTAATHPQPRACPMAAALQILGERWALLVLREIGYGVHRFDQIAGYTGGSRDILADRLRKLEGAGVVERRQYSARPLRYEYHLTAAGRDLMPVMVGLSAWGNKWASDTPLPVLGHDCGYQFDVGCNCPSCGRPVTPENLTLHGPAPQGS
jgi:DNA-binding HxlR family transcriptional regulator